jgi:aminoglycoside phosphotransferase (APT) family kinase protein
MYFVCFVPTDTFSKVGREAHFFSMTHDTTYQDIQAVINHFLPGGTVQQFKEHGSGHIHKTYRVTTDVSRASSCFLVQQFNHHVFKSPETVASNIAKVHAHLAAKPLDTIILRPISSPDEHFFYASHSGSLWRMFDFIEGGYSTERAESAEQAFLAGKAFGAFAAALSDLDPNLLTETLPNFHNSVKRWQYFENVVAADPAGRVSQAMPLIEEVERHHDIFFEVLSLPTPVRVIHNDAKLGNVLFEKATGRILAVTDWDTIMPGCILADFGDLVRSLISPVEEDSPMYDKIQVQLPYFEELCRGFLEDTSDMLTTTEKEHLVLGAKWIILEQALRFLTDYLAGDLYYPVCYSEHNKTRATNQLHLFKELLKDEAAMQAIVQKHV